MVRAKLLGFQDIGNGKKLRLYNVSGDHVLDGSTVFVETLLKEGIEIEDMTQEEIERELKLIKQFLEG